MTRILAPREHKRSSWREARVVRGVEAGRSLKNVIILNMGKIAFLVDFDGVIGDDRERLKEAEEGIARKLEFGIRGKLIDNDPIDLEGKHSSFIRGLAEFILRDKQIREELIQAAIMKEGAGRPSGAPVMVDRERQSHELLEPLYDGSTEKVIDNLAAGKTQMEAGQSSEVIVRHFCGKLGVGLENQKLQNEVRRRLYQAEVAFFFRESREKAKEEAGRENARGAVIKFGERLVETGYIRESQRIPLEGEWLTAWVWGGLTERDIEEGKWRGKERFTYPGGTEIVRQLQELGKVIVWTEGIRDYQTIKLALAGLVEPDFKPDVYNLPLLEEVGYTDLSQELAQKQGNEPSFLVSIDKFEVHRHRRRFPPLPNPIQEALDVLPKQGLDTLVVIDDKARNCDRSVRAIEESGRKDIKVIPVWVRQGDHVNKFPEGMNEDEAVKKFNAVNSVSEVVPRVKSLLEVG